MYYPLLFKSIYKSMVWGGTRLRDDFGRDTPFEQTGESWDISARREDMSVIANGAHEGMAFRTLIKKDTAGILGQKYINYPRFPLLVKLIDANDNLSVQVHPTDGGWSEDGSRVESKNEMWYVLEAQDGASLILGLKDGVSRGEFAQAVANGETMQCLHRYNVKKGDIIDVPAGLVHAIGKGIVLAEIQQNSDTTYRLYDYKRTDREGRKRTLHIQKALESIDYSGMLPKTPVNPRLYRQNAGAKIFGCIRNPHFTVRLLDIFTVMHFLSSPESFQILTVVDGDMYFEHAGGQLHAPVGTSVLIPALLGDYTIAGRCKVLMSQA